MLRDLRLTRKKVTKEEEHLRSQYYIKIVGKCELLIGVGGDLEIKHFLFPIIMQKFQFSKREETSNELMIVDPHMR